MGQRLSACLVSASLMEEKSVSAVPRGCVGARLQKTSVCLARSSHASHSQCKRQRQIIIAPSLEIIEIHIQTETSYTHSF